MELIDGIKSAFKLAQSLDNIELQKTILEIQQEALELQQENIKLQQHVNELEKQQDIENQIERHPDPYLTLKDDPQNLPYCSTCWATKHQLIQMWHDGEGFLKCPACKCGCSTDYKKMVNHRSSVQKINY